jgi:outer membrane protein TolC
MLGSTLFAACALSQNITLSDALATAQANRPAIASAQLRIDQAKAEARSMSAIPGLTFGIGHSTHQGLGATDQDLFLTQPLDVFGKATSLRTIGESRVRIAEADLQQARLAVQSEVLDTYLKTLAAAQTLAVSRDLQTIAESLAQATSRRYEEGVVPEVQALRAQLEVDRSKQTVALRQAQYLAMTKLLAGVTGLAEMGSVEATDLKDPAGTVVQRPEVRILEAQLSEHFARARAARAARRPDLEISALRSPWRDSPSQFGARIQLSWTVNDYGRSSQEIKAAELAAESTAEMLRDFIARSQAEIAALDIQIEASRAHVASFDALRTKAADLVEKSRRGYSEGYGSLLDVLEATRSLREVEQELVEARLELSLTLAAKYTATGTLLEAAR